MCNELHHDSVVPVLKNGKAWKVVAHMNGENEPRTMVYERRYNVQEDGWVCWCTSFGGNGFCVIPRRKVAERVLELWSQDFSTTRVRYKIIRVEYEHAVGRHLEENVFGETIPPIDTLLVKQWRQI